MINSGDAGIGMVLGLAGITDIREWAWPKL